MSGNGRKAVVATEAGVTHVAYNPPLPGDGSPSPDGVLAVGCPAEYELDLCRRTARSCGSHGTGPR